MAQLLHLSGRAYENSSGVPYALAKAYFYVTGTTTPLDTYTTAALTVANANPVVAGADGVFPDIYLAAKRYKIVIKDADGNTLRTWDPVDATTQLIAASSAPSPTYPFLRYHNTGDGHVYRRNAADNAWIDEGAVDSLFSAASVTETLTGTETAKAVTPDSLAAIWQRGTNITPTAGAVSLPSTGGGVFNIAAGNFSSISTGQGGRAVLFKFSGVSVITHNATSLRLPGAANITTAANDIAVFVNEAAADASGSNWACAYFVKYTGSPINIADFLGTQADLETATSSTLVSTIARMKYHPGVGKARVKYDQSSGTATAGGVSYNLSSLTDGTTGVAVVNFTTAFGTADYHPSGMGQRPATNSDAMVAITQGTAPTTTALSITTTVAAVAADLSYVSVVCHGDQA